MSEIKTDIPVYQIPNAYAYEDTTEIPVTPAPVQQPSKDIKEAINTIRTAVKSLQGMGFNVDVEEIDFEDIYQVIIKVEKD